MPISRRLFLRSGALVGISTSLTFGLTRARAQGEVAGSGLTLAAFAEQLNTEFRVQTGSGDAQAMRLIEVTASAPLSIVKSEAFSVVFLGPLDAPLEQNTYAVEHPVMGSFPLFIVPVGSTRKGIYYEAVFNRLLQAY